MQTAGVGQKLTISTSALIASSLCGAVHSAGVPFSQPPGTGLCYSASAGAVQKATGARCCVLRPGPLAAGSRDPCLSAGLHARLSRLATRAG